MNSNIIFPDYEHSILNLINSILKHYKVETKYATLPKLDKILEKEYKNIVLIILDGMGEHILKNSSPNGFFDQKHLDIITSVCPSTTAAALTTYYSGKPPIETGWIAMSQYFKEYGRAIEMFSKLDSYTYEEISDAKINVSELVKYITVHEQIESASKDVKAYEISPANCMKASKRTINADNIDSMCDSIKEICNNEDKNFIFAYNENPDAVLHEYGCNSKEVIQFIKDTENKIENMCKQLENTDTLFIISADHGHKDVKNAYSILDLKEIQDCIIMPPSLDARALTFWVKEDKKKQFEEYFKTKFKDEFLLFTKEEFLNKHILGYGTPHKKIDDFLGNYIAISISDSIIKLGTKVSKDRYNYKSAHCGFTKEEMEVPVIIVDYK